MTSRLAGGIIAAVATIVAALLALSPWSISSAPSAPAPKASAPSASAATTAVARMGSRSSKVVTIQQVVQASPDGVYGPETVAAVKVWQRSHGLAATGVVDSLTWSRMTAARVSTPAVGNDISWPQCPKGVGVAGHRGYGLPMPRPSAQFVVIGLTNGAGYSPNQCLASQVAWAKARHVYAAAYSMTTFPTARQLAAYGRTGPYGGATSAARLANAGFAQASFNVAYMRRAELDSPMVWVDVEPTGTPPWTKSTAANKAVIDGVLRGYQASGYQVGIYSHKRGYRKILGATRYGLPEWRTAGPSSQSVARGRCAAAHSLQGGPAVLAQWWTAGVDHNTTCPSANTPAVLAAYFHKY